MYSTKADVYSFGIVIWEVLTREVPFNGMSAEEVSENGGNDRDVFSN